MFPVRQSFTILLGVCQFSQLFYDLHPNNGAFCGEGQDRKEGRKERGKVINSIILGLPLKSHTDFPPFR